MSEVTNVGVDVFGDPPVAEWELCIPVLMDFVIHSCAECAEPVIDGSDDHLVVTGEWVWGLRRHATFHAHQDCATGCEWCSELFVNDAVHDHWSYGQIDAELCYECREEYLFTCERCERAFHNEESRSLDDYSYCEHCFGRVAEWCDACDDYHHCDDDPCENQEGSDLVRNYSYKPDAIFRYMDGANIVSKYRYSPDLTVPFYGFELETEAVNCSLNDAAYKFIDQINGDVLYLKEDGSLSHGFEIVTHPATLEYYQNGFDWSAINEIRNMGMKSWGQRSCGFHIHISRSAFMRRSSVPDRHGVFSDRFMVHSGVTPHLMAFMYFIYQNAEQVERLAGRNSSYGRIVRGEIHNLMSYCRWGNTGDRYMAVNVNNRHTIELRMFRGSLKKERVLGYIEFADAVFHYTREARVSKMKDKFSFLGFAQWAEMQPKYDNLTAMIRRTNALEIS